MSLIFLDGFEDGLTSRLNNPAVIINTTTPRSGLYCASFPSSTTSTRILSATEEHDTITVGMGIFISSATPSPIAFRSDNGATLHMYITGAVGGAWSVRNGTGTILASGGAIVASTWYYVEFKVKLHDTLGSYELRVNEVVIASATNVDTKNGGTKTVIDRVEVTNAGGTLRIDDMYICNGAGSVNNTFLGDCVVEGLTPVGSGASSQFVGSDGDSTNNYQLVDDTALTDYVESATSGNVDTYVMSDLARTNGTIYGVQVTGLVQKTDAGARGIKPVVRRAGTTYDGAETTLTQTPLTVDALWETDPSTSAAWTISGVNAIEAGFKVGT